MITLANFYGLRNPCDYRSRTVIRLSENSVVFSINNLSQSLRLIINDAGVGRRCIQDPT